MVALLNDPAIVIRQQGPISLADHRTGHAGQLSKKELKARLKKDKKSMSELQERLYASGKYSFLLIFQAMDAAGKDSCIRHVMSGVNPQGCSVHSFKAPTSNELKHDFLWRHAMRLPERGMIAIHNRSHYEEVLVVKVHPEYLLGQRIPTITSPADANADFWEGRYQSIREFEAHAARQGTIIMKFFLHMSLDQQKARFLERIDDPTKHWKFSSSDITERSHWDAYRTCYEEAIGSTASEQAPWFIVPADDQWETRSIVGQLIREKMESLALTYPELAAKELARLDESRVKLTT